MLAFARIGGLPGRIRYDNLKPAVIRVLLGRERLPIDATNVEEIVIRLGKRF